MHVLQQHQESYDTVGVPFLDLLLISYGCSKPLITSVARGFRGDDVLVRLRVLLAHGILKRQNRSPRGSAAMMYLSGCAFCIAINASGVPCVVFSHL
jgi:hypothetical protein